MKNIRALAGIAMLAATLFTGTTALAQTTEECYAITNGHQWWYEGSTWELLPDGITPAHQVEPAFNHVTSSDTWPELHTIDPQHVTLITEAGTYYAKLDIANLTVVATDVFDTCCVWRRTGSTGYYYQEHGNFIYYLLGGKNGIEVRKQSRSAATDKLSQWYNWDFGAAVKEIIFTDGQRKERYYWLMKDAETGEWTMSCNSYERPETAQYTDYDFSQTMEAALHNTSVKSYYCYRDTRSTTHVPAGQGALVMPVNITHHDKELPDNLGAYGLQSVGFTFDNVAGAGNTALAFGGVATVNTVINQSLSANDAIQVTPEYWHYAEETYRYGINPNWRLRGEDVWNSSGVPTIVNRYLYGEPQTFHDNPPTPTASDLVVESITYNLTPSSFRFLKWEIAGTEIDDPGAYTLTSSHLNDAVKIICYQVPPTNSVVKLTVTVAYTNGSSQTLVVDLPTSPYYQRQQMPSPTNAPVVHGSVFGGGRMAAIGQNTNVTVHNADSIYAVYGGNDIAGWVMGDGGASVTIGTSRTTSRVHIGWVYGGGCGYYAYRGINLSNDYGYPYTPGTRRFGLAYQNYYFGNSSGDAATHFDGSVYPWGTVPTWEDGYTPQDADHPTATDTAHLVWPAGGAIATGFRYDPVTHDPSQVDNNEDGTHGTGTIPYVKHSHIVIGCGDNAKDQYIAIDTVFGGAENAFIGVTSDESTPANAITMDINGGTIYAVFGGNNYGGAVANTATVLLNVYGTTLPATTGETRSWPVANYQVREATDDRSIFTGFGREYGIRYLYGGGNMVDGSHAVVTIKGGILDTVYGGGNSAKVHLPVVVVDCQGDNFICDNVSYWESYWDTHPGDFGPDIWEGEVGNYNIRTLFGGNNRADATTLGYLQLLSGGISAVYGGGNMGDMNNTAIISRPELLSLMGATLASSGISAPVAVGSIVYAPFDSKIICDYLFGGCRMANVLHSSGAVIYGGTFGYVNGGNDVSGDVGSLTPTTLYTAGGTVTNNPDEAVRGNRDGAYVFLAGNALVVGDAVGGSDGYYHCSNDGVHYNSSVLYDTYSGENYDPYNEFVNMAMPTHNNTYMAMFVSHNGYSPRVLGDVLTGGVHANVGFDENVAYEVVPADGIKSGSTHLELRGGHVSGNVFGGGYMSDIFGLGYLHVGGTMVIDGSLFAGNDLLGSVGAFGGYTWNGVPNETNYRAAQSSDLVDLNTLEGTSWNAQYQCYLKIDGAPTINEVYGGGNGAYNYDGDRPEYGTLPSLCPSTNGKTNRPLQSSSYIDINVTGGEINTVFGGGNGIGVQDVVTVLLNCDVNDPSYVAGEHVHTIFGGNNRDDMTSCVPDIRLRKGEVGDVYGGGNMGSMKGSAEFRDACGILVEGVSTHIKIDNTSEAIVNGTIYGGCRMADVTGMAFIEIMGGNAVQNVFGGNDISGSVTGNTRIDVSGGTVHNIFGGSNGYYDYDFVNNKYDVYTFGSDHSNANNLQAEGTTGAPYVDSTTVNLFGGTITTDVYGGGKLGDCRLTLVEVNDQVCTDHITPNLHVEGSIYGGGKGIDDNLNATRRGNVLTPETDDRPSRTHVNLRHATLLATSEGKVKAYGGGRGGDVMDTYIQAFSTWSTPFDEIYGGCWGSDVLGETHLILDGSTVDLAAMTAENVYGGNDFTGTTYKTNITINSGRYGYVFGGGNGDYTEDKYLGGTWNDDSHTSFSIISDPNYQAYAGTYTAADQVWNPQVTLGADRRVYEPNNEYAEINFNDGIVEGNLYGGGRQGTTMRYKRDANNVWLTQAGGASKQPDTFRYLADEHGTPAATEDLPYEDPEKYSHIIINVKNGTFEHNIYAGGMGRDGGNWIVYGLKELNIENGLIKESVYGGSENVSDGYARECVSTTNTTMRPSSILNITGGTIKNNVYGGGYLGNVHGSVYVNVGLDAVENCVLWTKTINDSANAYALFKPGAQNGHTPAMQAYELQLQASVYGGANWGDNVGSADFSKAGFYGGESRIVIDGEGYNTYMDDDHDRMPLLNIVHSLIGSGTSAEGGDIYNRIDVRNYGAVNPSTCNATRQLHAIQRANAVWLENTSINYTGATDAISAYLSQQYTINRIDTLNCVGYNVIDIDATMTNVANVNFLYNKAYTDALVAAHSSGSDPIVVNDYWFEPSHTYMYALNSLMPEGNICDEGASNCERLSQMNRNVDSKSLTALVINNGINVDIISSGGEYGAIRGFAYMVAQNGTNAVVTARAKYDDGGSGVDHVANVDDGGFVTSCVNDLQAITSTSGSTLEWCNCYTNGAADGTNASDCLGSSSWRPRLAEFPYSNYSTMYRVWKLGNGKRRRYSVIQAHSNPDSMYTVDGEGHKVYSNKKITLHYDGGTGHDSIYNFAIAEAKLVLPPTTPGNYYRIAQSSGIVIDDENQEMRLTDMSYKPVWASLSNSWKIGNNVVAREYNSATDVAGTDYEATANGEWHTLTPTGSGTITGANNIHNYTGGKQYFGLMMCSGNNFGTDAPQYATGWHDGTTISGNTFTNMLVNFATAQVGATVNASPEINLYLLYDNNFSHTMIGTVSFVLEEHKSVPMRANYDPNVGELSNTGAVVNPTVYIDSNLNADIEVEITISTILQDFATMEYEVLAMYNEGRNDNFSRKVVLPATLQQRELYLEGISWFPTSLTSNPNGDKANGDTIRDAINPDWFYLTDKTNLIKGQAANEHSYFGMTVLPTDNVSNTLVTANSWHTISMTEPLDLFQAVYGKVNSQAPTRAYNDHYYQPTGNNPSPTIETASLITGENPHGIKIGNLDGRGEAAINVTLKYDGERVYADHAGKGYVGKVVMDLVAYTGGDYGHPNRFQVIVNIKTRAHGDTIFLASPDYFDGTGVNAGTHQITAGGSTYYAQIADWDSDSPDKGKHPHSCATSFYDALTKVYQEGDVIAIIGEVKIDDGEQLLIKGQEYMPVPIIRYEGHHWMMPGEPCVYRGTMITVSGTPAKPASFTARCVEFKGSMVSKIEPDGDNGSRSNPSAAFLTAHPATYNPIKANDYKYADTNLAYGPIIAVKSNGTVTLQNGVILKENNNGYWSPAYQTAHPSESFDASRMGAISVTGGQLKLVNSVTVKHNLCNSITATPNWAIKPESGAIYVDGGKIHIEESHKSTAILVDSNYVVDTTKYWAKHTKEFTGVGTKLMHYDFNTLTSYGTSYGYWYDDNHNLRTRANVYLHRTEPTTGTQAEKDMADLTSRVIYFDKPITENTRIGVSKWFPDAAQVLRDTIQIAYQADGTYLQEAYVNNNFVPDNPNYFTFYNYGIDNVRMYLGRCATFKYQQLGDELVRAGSGVYTDTAIYYRPLKGASCPIGGDTIITRAQGGFFPYTYTWTNPGADFADPSDDVTIRTRKTTGTNKEIVAQYNLTPSANYAPFAKAVADTLYTDYVDMPYGTNEKTLNYLVTISDATDHCTLTKKMSVRLVKDGVDAVAFERTGTAAEQEYWNERPAPNTVVDHICTGDREYTAVSIIPRVKSPGAGAVAVVAPNDRDIFIISDDNDYTLFGSSLKFCQGDVIRLAASPTFHMEDDDSDPLTPDVRVDDSKFMMWDFDPYYSNPTSHVVPSHDETVVAYFAPLDYWKDVVTSTTIAHAIYDGNYNYTSRSNAGDANAGMVTTYNGDVHIYNENGLAWLISCINGFNGTQARTFHYNRVYIHYKDGGYDMADYKWTPMGTLQHPFEGMLIGVGANGYNADNLVAPWSAIDNTDPDHPDTTWTDPIVIKNIIVDEPNLENAGFFAVLDSARIINIQLQGATIRGAQNVGTLAARSSNSRIRKVNISSAPDPLTNAPDDPSTTILSTHYLSGGMLGLSYKDTIIGSQIAAKFIGDAVYSGGVVGHGTMTTKVNNNGYNINRLRGLYVGGIAGYLNGQAPVPATLFRHKTGGVYSRVENNYFRISTKDGMVQRVGGIAGYAENTIIANNYIYGDMECTEGKGGVTAVAANGTKANHNYYELTAAKIASDNMRGDAEMIDYSTFEGEGNHVILENSVYGINNLTRALNKWVREHNADGGYLTWRSDLNEENCGYPVFGQPDLIPVTGRLQLEGCEEVEFEGRTYTVDITLTTNTIDTEEMIDSTTTVTIIVHHGTRTDLTDSATMTEGYEGYGFTVTPAEAMLLSRTISQYGSAQMVLSDTLQTDFGCDSIVTLTLTITAGLGMPEVTVETTTVKVYPNPTTSEVNIEAEQMSHVELYDNEGRTLADYDAYGGDKLRINVSQLASGIYYLRVHTPNAVTIQKIVKR